ncbi:MAG: signal peptidase I [Peptococcaceae bacterium]|jgi:signal peptidase I|nr:signal peptidase I [Peptococcaceae bacterium]
MNGFLKQLLSWVALIFVAWIISLVIRLYVFDVRIVPTGSMLPTIQLNDRLIVDKLFCRFTAIQRGDVIVFRAPATAKLVDSDSDLVKRVIGLPGEKLAVHDGKVWINGAPLTEEYLTSPPSYTFEEIRIPENCFFMMGDNRNSSNDSHEWGVLPAKNIAGRVFVRCWPAKSFGKLAGPGEEGYGL